MRIILIIDKYPNFDIFRDKYPIFKFDGVNIQIGMC
jgi:hypothetical protein